MEPISTSFKQINETVNETINEEIQLEDLVYTYPPSDIPGFQTLISGKEEFRVTASGISEPVPKRGQLFKHQEYLLRLMRQYDNQLIIWRTGTGKSCGVIAVTEYYKNLAESLENIRNDSTSPYTHAYVLVRGPSLIEEFKNQLLCKCTAGDYITEAVKNSTSPKQRKNNITRALSKFYTIITYGTFARDLVKLTDEQIKQTYGHSIFIIDEVHNLSMDPTKGRPVVDPKTGNVIIMRKVKKGGKEKDVYVEQRLIYDQIWRISHVLSPRKIMLLSATPMINEASEIGPILNILLPVDKQLPINVNYNDLTIRDFETYLQGLISFVRELDTGAIPEYQGQVLNTEYDINGNKVKSQMVIYASQMSEHQEKTYNIAVNNPKQLKPKSEKPEAFWDLERQAANFVFPDGSTGTDGFRKYIQDLGNFNFVPTPELSQWLRSAPHLQYLSSKFSEIVRLCKDEPGNCWCYSHFVIGSGAILLSLCFENQGFQKFNEGSSIFVSTGGSGLPPPCAPETTGVGRQIRISKALRYALLTSETPGPEVTAMLEAFNSYENRHGEYIKAIIGSPVSRDGLNLANVLQIHLVGPEWNQSSIYQAESRAIRSTSHVDLINEQRDQLIRQGLNPDGASVVIKVYRHASITSSGRSIDIQMYETSERKDREIRRIMRMLKQAATDCQIHYGRNVRMGDIDGSAQCDYDVCAYECSDPPPGQIDYSSYDVLYNNDVINNIMEQITNIFHTEFNLSFVSLYSRINKRKKFVDQAVANLIQYKVPIIDRYGYTTYLREDKGILFLRRDYPLTAGEGGYDTSKYTENLIGIQRIPLNSYVGELQKGEQVELIEQLQTLDPNSEKFNKLIDDLNLENKVELLESSVYQLFVNKIQSPAIIAIINKYRSSVFNVPEPVAAIQITATALANRGKGRGRKPKPGSKFKLSAQQQEQVNEVIDKQEPAEIVYIHTLFNQAYDRTSYAVSAKFSKADARIRLLKPSENVGWRDANPYELPVYNTIIQKQLEEMIERFEEFDIYGTIFNPDRKFRIRDKTTENEAAEVDTRSVNRGRICEIWNKVALIDILYKLDIMPFKTQVNESRDELISALEREDIPNAEDFDDDKLKFYYKYIRASLNRKRLCDILQTELQKMGRLLVM